ncbi:hypothetical protein [Deinococcus cavernae]|nr:hypothetical protein [Deinococcus cavernae]
MKRITVHTQEKSLSTRVTDEQAENVILDLQQPTRPFVRIDPADPTVDPLLLVQVDHVFALDIEHLSED